MRSLLPAGRTTPRRCRRRMPTPMCSHATYRERRARQGRRRSRPTASSAFNGGGEFNFVSGFDEAIERAREVPGTRTSPWAAARA